MPNSFSCCGHGFGVVCGRFSDVHRACTLYLVAVTRCARPPVRRTQRGASANGAKDDTLALRGLPTRQVCCTKRALRHPPQAQAHIILVSNELVWQRKLGTRLASVRHAGCVPGALHGPAPVAPWHHELKRGEVCTCATATWTHTKHTPTICAPRLVRRACAWCIASPHRRRAPPMPAHLTTPARLKCANEADLASRAAPRQVLRNSLF